MRNKERYSTIVQAIIFEVCYVSLFIYALVM